MAISPADFNFIKSLVGQTTHNVLDPQRDYAVETRLQTLLDAYGFGSVQKLINALRQDDSSDLKRAVYEALLNNETMFFRDMQPFELLRTQIIPELIEQNQHHRTLTLWSAACSSGQEPYSLAMLLHAHFPQLAKWTVRIVASDISRSVLQRAETGRFRQIEVNRGLPASYLVRYFERDGMHWMLKPEIRNMVTFAELNLAQPLPRGLRYDVIFLRNALLYFDVETKRTVLSQLESAIKPGGYLFLGTAETTLSISERFNRRFDKIACYQLAGREEGLEMFFDENDLREVTQSVWELMLHAPLSMGTSQTLPRGAANCVTATVEIHGAWNGAVTLLCFADLASELASTMFQGTVGALPEADVRDAMGELANMVGGNMRALLPEQCQLSLPKVHMGATPASDKPVYELGFTCRGKPFWIILNEGAPS